MLPSHKSCIETLFCNQSMKVVFAIEILAAGINMPAKTTVICSMSKPGGSAKSSSSSSTSSQKQSNDGSRKSISSSSSLIMNCLDTHNLLQMAGRAGRHVMDIMGTCVLMSTPYENEIDAIEILLNQIEPIISQFTLSYTLCIQLLSRSTIVIAIEAIR